MLEIQRIRQESDSIIQSLGKRGLKIAEDTVSQILSIDQERRKALTEMEGLRSEQNTLSKSVGALFAQKKIEEANAAKDKSSAMKAEIEQLQNAVRELEEKQKELLYLLPNTPHESVPAGTSDEDNQEVFRNREPDQAPEWAKPHWEICKALNIIDFDLGAKITGAGFPVYIGQGARLQRALITYFLDKARDAGFIEIMPPHLVNEDSGYGTGQLPDKEGQMYHAQTDNLYLIPTAEVPITNLYRDVIVNASEMPIKNCGYTPCFRREAGSYGKDVRGLNRLHQFDKVEIVQIAHPNGSYDILEEMVEHVKGLLEDLGLPYRILNLCGGDLGFAAAKTYDMEVWSSAQERWLEVSSISNFETYQSNRMKLRFRDGDQKPQLAHTLNGSALALPRIFASIIENNQNEDGTVNVPKALVPYTGFEKLG